MSDNQNPSGIGEQMKDALTEALRSGDFKNLNVLVSQTVINTVNEVKRQINPRTDQGAEQNSSSPGSFSEAKPYPPPFVQGTGKPMPPPFVPVWQQRMQIREQEKQRQRELQEQEMQKNSLMSLIRFKRVGSVSNILYQVFGGIGLGITGFITFIHFMSTMTGDYTLGGWIANLIFLAAFYGMIRLGVSQKKRLKRAERYIQLCGERKFAEVAGLARATGKGKGFVKNDLQKMLEIGMFPEGHLDESRTCFMLNDAVYRQYLEAETGRMMREEETQAADEYRQETETVQATSAEESELDEMMAEGMEFLRKLRDLNDKIPGEVISAKLFCLENLLKDIFDGVKTHPEQRHQMHKLMSYYLPTTLKLVESYEEFDRIKAPGEDIVKAKAEIENTLDTINEAFRELLNKLFQHAVFDATTDAQVLKSMLAREGLTKEMEFATLDR